MARGSKLIAIIKCFLGGMVMLVAISPVSIAIAASYDDLLAQAKGGAAAVDFTTLRYAYAGSSQYNPYDAKESELRALMQKAYEDKNYPEAIKQAQAILDSDFVNIDAHIISDLSFRRLNQPQQAKYHEQMVRGLIQSIAASGDGKTPETAFVVISISEEYSLLFVRGLKKVKQALRRAGDHRYDQMSVEDKSGGKDEIFFNIDRPESWFRAHNKPGNNAH